MSISEVSLSNKPALSVAGSLLNGIVTSCVVITICQPIFAIKTNVMSKMPLPKVKQLYVGFRANLACDISYQAVAFAAFSFYAQHIMGGKKLTDRDNFFGGIFAGCMSAPILGFLERTMILQQVDDNPVRKRSITATVKNILAVEGRKGLTKGLSMTMLRESVNSSCFFCLSQLFQSKAEEYLNPNYACLFSYQLSGAIAGFLSTPLDILKTRIQNNLGLQASLAALIASTSKADLVKSASARILTLSSTMMIMGIASNNIPQYFPKILYQNE